jgi:hypothetical protein
MIEEITFSYKVDIRMAAIVSKYFQLENRVPAHP